MISAIWIFLFSFPYIFLPFQVGLDGSLSGTTSLQEIGTTFSVTGANALISTTIALSFGILALSGTLILPKWAKPNFVFGLALSPSVLPTFFVLLSFLNLTQSLGFFLRGFWSIAFLHGIMNIGVVAVTLHHSFQKRILPLLETCEVLGPSRFQFWRMAIGALAKDIFALGIVIFGFCFSSFGIPFVLGRGEFSLSEVAIFEKIHIHQDLSGALLLSLFQTLFLASLILTAKIVSQRNNMIWDSRETVPTMFPARWGLKLGWIPLFLPGILLFLGIVNLNGVSAFGSLLSELGTNGIWSQVFGSIGVLSVVWILFGFAILTLALNPTDKMFPSFLLAWISPSTVILGFALLLFPGLGRGFETLKLGLGLFLIFFPLVYRLFLYKSLMDLIAQYQMARVLGANSWVTAKRIVFPQWRKPIVYALLLLSIWTWGDFALSSVVATGDFTLGLLVKSLMSQYRISAALGLIYIHLGVALFCGLTYLFLRPTLLRKSDV